MSVRFVVLAGEKADQGIVSLSKQLVPQARLINEYGPTENSVAAAACFEMSAGHVNSIGTPISNNQVFILDGDQKLIPIGIYGELCVSGDSLARGYLNRPELTQEKFIPNPYIQDVEMYKTGDLARWEEDGNISILGRIDNQVKIRGYRIEPGEIEKQLLRHPEIKEAVVIPRNDNRGEKWLCAYFTSKHELSAAEIRGYLETHLPGYMIPAFFIEIELFPLNVNGKIDLKKLPEPAGYMNSGVEYQAPRTDIEKSLVLIWQKELGLDKIGIHDNYFNIGGDSIKSIRLINTINEELNKKLNVVDLYTNNTIEQLAQKIEQEPQCDDDGNSQVSGEYGEVLSELEELQKKIMGGGNLGNE
jgi:bacitracin synthase 3